MLPKIYYSPGEAVQYLNNKLHPDPLMNLARLARLRRSQRIQGVRIGETMSSIYTQEVLDIVNLEDIQDKRKTGLKTP